MLKSINIENYAIIDSLRIDFDRGLSIITGETGAGKSILLGALALALGQRADINSIKNKSKNCIIEVVFALDKKKFEPLFNSNDIDFDECTIFRRVINANGKSRAFINDIPVGLTQMKNIGEKLVDIHSQHQNLLLTNNTFQMTIVDTVAKNKDIFDNYQSSFKNYKDIEKQLQLLKTQAEQAKAEYDYLSFQSEQLGAAKLADGEQEQLEAELQQLTHAEEIKTVYTNALQLLANEENSTNTILHECVAQLKKIENFSPKIANFVERLESCKIEIADIADEIDHENENIGVDTSRQEFVENRLDTIYNLLKKHNAANVSELIAIYENICKKLDTINNFDSKLEELQNKEREYLQALQSNAQKLHNSRQKVVGNIETHVVSMLKQLGMPNAKLNIKLATTENFASNGNDSVEFLFSANKEIAPQEISRVASGGEMSRLMLSLKSLVIESGMFPTIIFDEIDTGISGDVADKTGEIINKLAQNSQIINITHLPQIASKGNAHYLVYKETKADTTTTNIRRLKDDERIMEIAKLLSGSNVTQAAVDNARELLKAK